MKRILAIAAFTLLSVPAFAQESFHVVQNDEEAALNGQAGLAELTLDGGVGSGPDLSGNGGMVVVMQLQPQGGASIAGSAATSRYAAVSAGR